MGERRTVYLDYAASAPRRPECLAVERAFDEGPLDGANPNSLHTSGRAAATELERARSTVARCLGGGFRPSDVIWTSGGTESNNLAVMGISQGVHLRDGSRNAVVISAIEHDSIVDLVSSLHDRGLDVRVVRPGRDGRISPEALAEVVDTSVALVSIMYANNETGIVQDIPALSSVAHASGAIFHTDAVQAFGHIQLELDGVDAVSVAAHKLGGPVGVGALAVRGRVPLRPLLFGGGQEAGRRAGTQDVRGAMAFAATAEACCRDVETTRALVAVRAQHLYDALCVPGTGIFSTTTPQMGSDRLPGIVSVMVPGIDSETMILALDDLGFEVSAGSACSSTSLDASHVLTAMGIERESALGSLRISFDERVPEEDLMSFADALISVVNRLSVSSKSSRRYGQGRSNA